MPVPSALYELVLAWLVVMGIAHQTTREALAVHVTAVLSAQSLGSASRMRALLSAATVPARQRYLRLARALSRPSLSSERLTPLLVRAVLALGGSARSGETILALDSVRCGPWEILTLGVVWRSRALPVGWAVLPYPWPKGQFTPTVCRMIRQVAQAWPQHRRAHLVADRGFPSLTFFETLRQVGWAWTVRLRAGNWVVVAGQPCWVRDLLGQTAPGSWDRYAGTYGSGPRAVAGHLVVGKPQRQVPQHQQNPSSHRAQERQQARRQQHVATKHHGRTDASAETVAWLVLFTSASGLHHAVTTYRRRWAIEGSYRDAQSGWDGQHGWDLEASASRLASADAVAALVGLWALSALIQLWLGQQVVYGPAPVRLVAAQWTTTGRLSHWARGRLVLTDRSGACLVWLQMTLNRGAERIAAAPPRPTRRSPQQESLPCVA